MSNPSNLTNLRNQPRSLLLARTATLGLIILVLGYAIAGLIAQIGAPLPSFAGSYVAASAAIHVPGAPVYDYGTLLRLNAAHQYVTADFYPFVAPPFALLALAPLALLPYATASVFWLAITRLCTLGAALALADAFAVVIARREESQAPKSGRTLTVLRQTSPRIGAWRFPAAPFALGAALLLLALPPLDAISWDSLSLVAILLVAVALDAFVRGHPLLAGFAVALASGFSFLPLVLVACFLIRGAWKAAVSAIFFTLAVAAAPLLFFPARSYGDLAAALRFAQGVYGSSDHNASLLGAASTAIVTFGHMGTRTFIQASKAGTLLTLAVAVVTLVAFVLLPLLRRRFARTEAAPDGHDVIWLSFAAALSTPALALPLVWPDDSSFALVAVLLVGAYPFMRSRSAKVERRMGDAALLLAAVVALILFISVLPFGLDTTDLQLLDRREALYLARPAATAIIWAAALGALLVPYVRLLWRIRRPARVAVPQEELMPV